MGSMGRQTREVEARERGEEEERIFQWVHRKEGVLKGHPALVHIFLGDELIGKLDQNIPTEVVEGEHEDEFAARIWEEISADALVHEEGRRVLYKVVLYRKDDLEELAQLKVIAMGGSAPDESPNETGITQALMRHQEQNMVTSARTTELVMSKYAELLERSESRNDKMHAMRMEEMGVIRRIMLDQTDLEIAREKAKSDAFLWGKLFEQFELFLPIVVGQLLKKKSDGSGPSEEEEEAAVELKVLMGFIFTLEPDQHEKVGAILEPTQRAALATIMKDPGSKDAVDPLVIPVLVSRVISTITMEQKNDIESLLKSDEQFKAWESVFRLRKLSVGWQKEEHLLSEKMAGEVESKRLSSGGLPS